MFTRLALVAAVVGITLTMPVTALSERQLTEYQQKALDIVMGQRALCRDPATADSMYAALGQALASETDSVVRAYTYRNRFLAARALDHPDSMQAAADSAVLFHPLDQVVFHQLANYLGEKRLRLDVAEVYARRAVLRYGPDEPADHLLALSSLGYIQATRAKYEDAIPTLEKLIALPRGPVQWSLYYLGWSYQRTGRPKEAADAFIRSTAAFHGDSALAHLASAGLDSLELADPQLAQERDGLVARARDASRQHELFEKPRDGRRLRTLQVFDLRKSKARTVDFGSGVTVMDVWGTWCEPCRKALPGLRPLASRYASSSVRFIALSIEPDGPEKSRERVLRFLSDNGVTFDAFAGDSAAVARLAVVSYPTTFVIRNGRIEYRNVGESSEALDAQLKLLVAVKPK
jgi:thiol-disulfide isomerase/thioredoxin